MKIFMLLFALVAGMLAPLQAGLNTRMGRALGDTAALTFSLVVAGQLIMAVFLDHLGLFGIQVDPISWMRVMGIVLITLGVVLIRKF